MVEIMEGQVDPDQTKAACQFARALELEIKMNKANWTDWKWPKQWPVAEGGDKKSGSNGAAASCNKVDWEPRRLAVGQPADGLATTT